MRLLLDADLSYRRIGAPLGDRGHDVVALQADPLRRSLSDEHVLELAATETRILITRNARHFEPLARLWADTERSHAGLILIWTMRSNEFKAIVAAVDRQLTLRPAESSWRDLVVAL